jgi:hypothetical protein
MKSFEEWNKCNCISSGKSETGCCICIGKREAWGYQQKKIDKLEKKLAKTVECLELVCSLLITLKILTKCLKGIKEIEVKDE